MTCKSQHAPIFSLPIELLQEIVKLTYSLPALRLVCKTFNDVVTPEMFSQASIAYKEGKLDEFLEVLQSLARNEHPAIPHAKSLKIGYLSPPREHFKVSWDEKKNEELKLELSRYCSHSESVRKWLQLGLSRLNEVTSIIWTVHDGYSHKWSRDCAISEISKMSSLTSIELTAYMNNRGYIDVSSFPPLRVLSVNTGYTPMSSAIHGIPELIKKSSGQLRQLKVQSKDSFSGDGKTPLLSFLFHKVSSLWSLKYLFLEGFKIVWNEDDNDKFISLETVSAKLGYGNNWPKTGDFWLMLKTKKVHLKEITIDTPNESFMQYLQSYTVLRTLTIKPWGNNSGLAKTFYGEALLCHAASLRKLVINPSFEGEWCFGEHCIPTLHSRINLRHLSISIDTDSGKYRGHRRLGPAKSEKPKYEYDPTHAVCQLLQVAPSIPRLELLTILSASMRANAPRYYAEGDSESDEIFRTSTPIYFRKVDPGKQIDTNVTSFGPLNPSDYKFTIELSDGHLKPQKDAGTGEYRYGYIHRAKPEFRTQVK